MSAHRLRRWANINPTLNQCLVYHQMNCSIHTANAPPTRARGWNENCTRCRLTRRECGWHNPLRPNVVSMSLRRWPYIDSTLEHVWRTQYKHGDSVRFMILFFIWQCATSRPLLTAGPLFSAHSRRSWQCVFLLAYFFWFITVNKIVVTEVAVQFHAYFYCGLFAFTF